MPTDVGRNKYHCKSAARRLAMARMLWIGFAAFSLFLSTGCVSLDKHKAVQLELAEAKDQLSRSQSDLQKAQGELVTLHTMVDQFAAKDGTNSGILTNLNDTIRALTADNATLKAQYEAALRGSGGAGPLNPGLADELAKFAAENPDLIEFDAQRGIVKFKSDVTFALGSAELAPKAKEVIDRFATILNSPAARQYELLVVGHTDSARVASPQTIAAGHKDNWFLSAHRAIAVSHELMAQSVDSRRMGVAGYADQRPVASNNSDAGRAQNRRVEVVILPSTVRVGGPATPVTPAKGGTINKDTAPAPTPKILNK
jgi:chemotaxis protein MotB